MQDFYHDRAVQAVHQVAQDDPALRQVQALERIADGLELVAHHAARLQQFVECLNGTLGHTNEILNRIALAKGT